MTTETEFPGYRAYRVTPDHENARNDVCHCGHWRSRHFVGGKLKACHDCLHIGDECVKYRVAK